MRVTRSVDRALCLLSALTVMGCARGEAPKVILFIADGAGVAHWTLARFAKSDLAVTRMPVVGLVDTRGHGHTVSGSAATATAYSTGLRTFVGAVGVGPDSMPAETVAEAAIARGMATGLVTTTWIVDATPAAFGAHSVTRAALGDIARQMGTAGVKVLIGGGRRAFEPALQPDSVDLLAELQDEYTYVADADQLRALDPDTVSNLLALLAEGDMGIVEQRGATTFRDMVRSDPGIFDLGAVLAKTDAVARKTMSIRGVASSANETGTDRSRVWLLARRVARQPSWWLPTGTQRSVF